MSAEEQMNNEVSAFEARLAKLAPADAAGASELMYRAGLATGARGRRKWQVFAAAAGCLAAAAGVLNLTFPRTTFVEVQRVVYVPARASPGDSRTPPAPHAAAGTMDPPMPAPTAPYAGSDRPVWTMEGLSKYSYLRQRDAVLAHGLSALPASPGGPAAPENPRRLLEELLPG